MITMVSEAPSENFKQFRETPYYISHEGEVFRRYRATQKLPDRLKKLNPSLNTNGYPRVHLSIKGVSWYREVHLLVCEVFHGPKPFANAEVNHKNGVKTDNRPENLEWVTPAQNNHHAREMGLMKPRPIKLTPELVETIRRSTLSHGALAKKLNLGKGTVAKVRLGITWKHIKRGIKKRGGFPREGVGRKLTPDKVRQIRNRTEGHEVLAREYGVHSSTIREIRNRLIWKHV